MKVLKNALFGMLVVFMTCSLSVLSFGQNNVGIDKERLADIVDSPRSKRALAKQFDGVPPGIEFDTETMVFDFFRENIIVVTLDFEYVPLGRHGTASIAYKWTDMDFILLYSSYWWWGTLVDSDIYTDTTWTAAGSPYYVEGWRYVEYGVTLTIEPGTVIRFRKRDSWGSSLEVYGTLNCSGATFTSSCDFENYDNSQIEYGDSDWDAIYAYDEAVCSIEDSLIEYAYAAISCWGNPDISVSGCTIKRCYTGLDLMTDSGSFTAEDNLIQDCDTGIYCYYYTSSSVISGNTITMGPRFSGYTGIYCRYSSPVITSNTISEYPWGISCSASSPDISMNTFLNNGEAVETWNGSSPVIHDNNFEGNTFGVDNEDDMVLIDAENNWWGDASGPYHPVDNPSGLGDQVSDYVDFDPWLTSAVTSLMRVGPH